MLKKSDKLFFLLGGYDLEMSEIKKLLDKYGYDCHDKQLSWGASWDDYQDIINDPQYKDKTFVGIELSGKDKIPEGALDVDHHNDLPPLPTSIEQVAKLINADISDRHFQLVIQNDIGHIQGMRTICATEEEIRDIRSRDREAQGIPEAWLEIAKKEVKNARYTGDLAIIETSLESTTPVSDVFQHSKLLVHNNKKLTYSGIGANSQLKDKFKDLFGKNPAWVYSGGAYDGYFGVTEEGLKQKGLDTWIEEISEAVSLKDCFSTHTFMLPLRWDFISRELKKEEKTEDLDFDDRTSLKNFQEIFVKNNRHWKRSFFRINSKPSRFNEFTYFHDYVQKVIYDAQQWDEQSVEIVSERKMMLYYEIEPDKEDFYEMDTPAGVFRLHLKGIGLHVFNTGVLILTINTENYNYPQKEQILHINEFGRRIYPQFLGDGEIPTQATKGTFLACKLTLNVKGQLFSEDFKTYDDLQKLETSFYDKGAFNFKYNEVIYPPKFLEKLLNGYFAFNEDDARNKGRIKLTRITDDRMFFQCWYGNNGLSDNMKIRCGFLDKENYAYLKSEWWYCYVFGDKQWATLVNEDLLPEHLKRHTYARWVGLSTLYGLSRDSLVCISNDLTNLKKFNAPDLKLHMQSIYYQITVICLAQRASILKFSAEVSNLGDLAKDDKKKLPGLIKNLYLNYIEFINKLYFREVTSQIQGIEMYSQLQEVMNIHRDVKDLDTEIEELHRFANLLVQEKQSREASMLTWVATLLLPATVIGGFLGMNIKDWQFDGNFSGEYYAPFWIPVGFSVIATLIIIIILRGKSLKNYIKNKIK